MKNLHTGIPTPGVALSWKMIDVVVLSGLYLNDYFILVIFIQLKATFLKKTMYLPPILPNKIASTPKTGTRRLARYTSEFTRASAKYPMIYG